MEERVSRTLATPARVTVRRPLVCLAAVFGVLVLGSGSAARGAEIRFVESVLTVPETSSMLAVDLELAAPECPGTIHVAESVVTLRSTAGGPVPATPRADFAVIDELVPLGVTGRAPVRFGRLLRAVVMDDGTFDGFSPETFLLELSLPTTTTVECDDGTSVPLSAGPPLTVEIIDDEEPPVIAFSRSNDRVEESQGSKTYSLVKSGTGGAVTATLSASPSRVTIEPSVVTFADGESGARDFTVFFTDDDVVQGNQQVRLTFQLDGAVAGEPDELVITILDDDEKSVIAFNRGRATVDEARRQASFALRRTGRGDAVTATLSADSAAVELEPSTLRWGAGETGDRRFTVRFTNDNRLEDDRSIVLRFDFVSDDTEPAAPERLVITIVDDDDASSLAVTGGDNQLATAGSDLAQPLRLRVANQAGQGVEGVEVLWSVVAGDATLIDGAATRTDAQGLASNRVRLGSTPGTVRVRAVVGNLVADFTADVLGDDPVAGALIRACGDDPDNLNGVCGYFRDELSSSEQRAVIEEIRPEEVASQANVTQDAPRVQLGNVGARLAALRQAGTRSGVQQLALNVRGLSLNPYTLTTALRRRAASELDPVAAVDRALADAVSGSAPSSSEAGLQDDAPASGSSGDSIAQQGRLGFYVNGSASFGDRPGTALESGFDFDTLGLTAGLDYRVKANLFLGGALGYMNTDTDLSGDGGELESQGLSLSLYLMRYWEGGLYVQGVVGYGEADHDLVRNVDLPMAFRGRTRYAARGETDGTQASLAFELGYDASRGAWTVGGFGRASWIETDIDRYRETGDADGSGFYLEVFDQSTESLLSEAGVNVSYAASFSWGVLLPQGRLSYLHEFEDESRDIRARFIEDTDPTNVFAIPTEEPDRDYFNVGVGFGAQFQRGISAFLFYDTDVDRDDLDVSTVSAGVRFEF